MVTGQKNNTAVCSLANLELKKQCVEFDPCFFDINTAFFVFGVIYTNNTSSLHAPVSCNIGKKSSRFAANEMHYNCSMSTAYLEGAFWVMSTGYENTTLLHKYIKSIDFDEMTKNGFDRKTIGKRLKKAQQFHSYELLYFNLDINEFSRNGKIWEFEDMYSKISLNYKK